ncbi:MAG: glycosyltransferase family 4 protein [Cyanobacteria bacterium P01_A01_bin.116]
MSLAKKVKPLKILISAYACKPNVGSEPGVGWNIVCAIAGDHELVVFTREDNRSAIEAELCDRSVPNLKFIYIDLPKWAAWLPSAQLPHYYLWQIETYFVAKKMLISERFDLAHHVTYVRYSTPSFLSLLPLPFIWGPVGGGEQAPNTFWKSFSLRGKLYEILRTLSHRAGERDPFTKLTARRSISVGATTQDTAERLKKMGATHIQVASAIGLTQAEITQLAEQPLPPAAPVRFISIARLLHWKGIYLGLQAFAQLVKSANQTEHEYWIVGEGPERSRLKALTDRLEITNHVRFVGSMPREQTLQKLSECHILLHPSLHDSGGFVCLEAMAAGRPVICLALGGPAFQVSTAAGILVAAKDPEQSVSGLAQAMLTLSSDPELRESMGRAGRKHVQENHAWEAKGAQLKALYSTCLSSD